MRNEFAPLAIPPTPPHGSDDGGVDGFELFRTPASRAFVDIRVNGHRETYAVSSDVFRRWLLVSACKITGRAPSATELKRQVGVLEAMALGPGTPEREVHLRTAFADGRIFLDLCDNGWNVIEIDQNGWRVSHNPPVRFIRMPGMSALPMPVSGGSIDTLRSFVNLRDDNEFVLFVAWLLDALHKEGGFPPLVLGGAQGTAKSTLLEIVRALVDPSHITAGALPHTERELIKLAGQRYLQPFDNLSGLSRQMSDALCRLSGACPIVLNGIENFIARPDLADRCLFITCDSIPDEQRRSEVRLWADFQAACPQLLGVLLDAMSVGLRTLPAENPTALPRMADFALWATACETAFWPAGTFTTAYSNNIAEAVATLIESDPVASAVRSMMVERTTWTGIASRLFATLAPTFSRMGGKVPVSARDLAVKLRKAATSLGKIGFTVDFQLQGHNRDRIITISSASDGGDDSPHPSSTTSAASSPPPAPEYSASSSSAPPAPEQESGTNAADNHSCLPSALGSVDANARSESGEQVPRTVRTLRSASPHWTTMRFPSDASGSAIAAFRSFGPRRRPSPQVRVRDRRWTADACFFGNSQRFTGAGYERNETAAAGARRPQVCD